MSEVEVYVCPSKTKKPLSWATLQEMILEPSRFAEMASRSLSVHGPQIRQLMHQLQRQIFFATYIDLADLYLGAPPMMWVKTLSTGLAGFEGIDIALGASNPLTSTSRSRAFRRPNIDRCRFNRPVVLHLELPPDTSMTWTTVEETSARCFHCLQWAVGLRKCSGCYVARYCHRGCQRADFSHHRVVCSKLRELKYTLATARFRVVD